MKMPDEGNPVIDAGVFMGEDGAFAENYLEQMYGEDDPMRTNPTLQQTKGIRSMASQLVNAQKKIGQFTSGRDFAILPNETSDETEIAEYHQKIGVPKDVAGYGIAESIPEGMAKDEKFIEHMGNTLLNAGTPAPVAKKIMAGYLEYIQQTAKAALDQEALDNDAANKTVREKFGAAYDDTMLKVNNIVRMLGNKIDPAETEAFIKELPNDPYGAQMMAAVADLLNEKKVHIEPSPADGALTPSNAIAKANELMQDPYYTSIHPEGKTHNPAYHQQLVEKVKALFEMATNKGGA
jgi:hypothetical protein